MTNDSWSLWWCPLERADEYIVIEEIISHPSRFLKNDSKKFTNIPFSIQFISAYCKDFQNLYLKNGITLKKSSSVLSFINLELPVFELWGWGELKWKLFKEHKCKNFP